MRKWLLCMMLVAASATAGAKQSPQELVSETTGKITTALRAEQDKIKTDPNRLYVIVDEIVLPHFDFRSMSAWVLGKHWRTANEDEKARFTAEFRTLLVRTYAKALNDNYDRKIAMLPMRDKEGSDDVTVRTEVQQEAGFPIPIDYKMHVQDGAWKVYDVSVDGLSLVANYRTSFAKEIREAGLPKLIDRLADRNKQAKTE